MRGGKWCGGGGGCRCRSLVVACDPVARSPVVPDKWPVAESHIENDGHRYEDPPYDHNAQGTDTTLDLAVDMVDSTPGMGTTLDLTVNTVDDQQLCVEMRLQRSLAENARLHAENERLSLQSCMLYFILKGSMAIGSTTLRLLFTRGCKTCCGGRYAELLRGAQVLSFLAQSELLRETLGVVVPPAQRLATLTRVLHDSGGIIELARPVTVLLFYSTEDSDGCNELAGEFEVQAVCTLEHVISNCDVRAKVRNWKRQAEKPQSGIRIESPSLVEILVADDGARLTRAMLKEIGVDELFTTHYVQNNGVYWCPNGPANESQNWAHECEKAWQSEYTCKMDCYLDHKAAGTCTQCGQSRSGKGSARARPRAVSERMGLLGEMRPDVAGRRMERQCEHFHGGPYRVSNAWRRDQLAHLPD